MTDNVKGKRMSLLMRPSLWAPVDEFLPPSGYTLVCSEGEEIGLVGFPLFQQRPMSSFPSLLFQRAWCCKLSLVMLDVGGA